jgi:hypothetical protein
MTNSRISEDKDPLRGFATGSFSEASAETPSSSFASLMQSPQNSPTDSSKLISPFELATAKPNAIPDPHSILAQMQLAQNTIEGIQGQLTQPNFKLKPSKKYLVKNKLLSANDNLRVVAAKLGSTLDEKEEEKAPSLPSKDSSPVGQFLGYLTDGLAQLESTKRQVAMLGRKPDLSPADFLFMQVKLTKAQQELEFTSTLLAKTIDGFKQIMNIQI